MTCRFVDQEMNGHDVSLVGPEPRRRCTSNTLKPMYLLSSQITQLLSVYTDNLKVPIDLPHPVAVQC